jgi:hypothetical protein
MGGFIAAIFARGRPALRSTRSNRAANWCFRETYAIAAALTLATTCNKAARWAALLPGSKNDYLAFISATVVSSIRLEKPHSLSYQLDTLTSRPLTLVRVASKALDSGL